jgi:serine phosphatase RsbU (regulator of sigma subunit)
MTPRGDGPSLAKSRAFRKAAVRSEVVRAYGVIGIAIFVGFFVIIPTASRQVDPGIRITAGLGLAAILALQIATIAIARWAQKRERNIPTWIAAVSLIVEALIPSAMILTQILRGAFAPYAALSAPPILVYGLMIALSTLRLRPWMCVMAGALCAGSYGGLVAYVAYGLGVSVPSTGLPLVSYVNAAVIIFVSGLAAAWVTREIRRHMDAALTESETRHQMERLEHDLSIAQSIQRALLPRESPAIPGFDIAGWGRPADQTGGDYYDWQALPGGAWIVTLADVSGHGIGPALVTAACRAYSRASSYYNADLASLTARMNRLLSADLPDGRFVTMVTVLIDPAGGQLQLLSAGHGPIVLYVGHTGKVQDIRPQDLPLAVDAESTFGPAIPVDLKAGDVLALVTDGFVEWTRRATLGREQYGMHRLRESLRVNAHLSAQAMIDAVAADVAAFAAGEPQQDDLTMVIIKAR